MSERITIIDFVEKYTRAYSDHTFLREKINGKWVETTYEQSRKEAEKSLRDEVSRYALAIADQVTRQQLKDDKAQQKLVDSLLDEMETKN